MPLIIISMDRVLVWRTAPLGASIFSHSHVAIMYAIWSSHIFVKKTQRQ